MAMDSVNAMMGHLPRLTCPTVCIDDSRPSASTHSSSLPEHDESVSQSPPTFLPATRLLLSPCPVRLLFKQTGANAVTR